MCGGACTCVCVCVCGERTPKCRRGIRIFLLITNTLWNTFCTYQHTGKKMCCWTIFTLIFLSRFPKEKEKVFRFLEKKSENILAVNFFSAHENFRNRWKKYLKICSFAQNRFIFTFLEFSRDFIFSTPTFSKVRFDRFFVP